MNILTHFLAAMVGGAMGILVMCLLIAGKDSK